MRLSLPLLILLLLLILHLHHITTTTSTTTTTTPSNSPTFRDLEEQHQTTTLSTADERILVGQVQHSPNLQLKLPFVIIRIAPLPLPSTLPRPLQIQKLRAAKAQLSKNM
jgi:hypothetical protein